jgi:hypothetical protein
MYRISQNSCPKINHASQTMFSVCEAHYLHSGPCFTLYHIPVSTVIIPMTLSPPWRVTLLRKELHLKFSLQYASVSRRCCQNKPSKESIHGRCHYNACATHDTFSTIHPLPHKDKTPSAGMIRDRKNHGTDVTGS